LSTFGYLALPALRACCPGAATVDVIHAEAPYEPMDHVRLAKRYRHLLRRRVVTTETVRRAQLDKYGEEPRRVVVIPNGVDCETIAPARYPLGTFRRRAALAEDVKIVLFFGRLAEEKQPLHIVEVAHRLRGRKDMVFAIVGVGPERAAVEQEIRARQLDNVVLCGPEDNIGYALADADQVFFPSKREGLPMSGTEALAMGVPVVASDVTGWTDLIEDGAEGFLVADGDFDGYADAIVRIAEDPELRARLSRAARGKAVRSFDVRVCVRGWERLFESLSPAGGRIPAPADTAS
jgi:glycosyltransferase involved in cell wall biosynthesis